MSKNKAGSFILWPDAIDKTDSLLVGGKAANIGTLIKAGISYPPGFCITTKAFDFYLNNSGVQDKVLAVLKNKSKSNESVALEIKELLRESKVPKEIQKAVNEAYGKLQNQRKIRLPLAIRSSATVEDLKGVSFAGQFDSFLGIINKKNLIRSVKKCWDSSFNARSIAYIRRRRLKTVELKMGVIVQKLIMARAAGVMFTIHPVTLEKNNILIESTFGLGNQLVLGKVNPDIFILTKDNLEVIQQTPIKKKIAVKFDLKTKKLIKSKIAPGLQNKPSLKMQEIKKLGQLGKQIESIFNYPQDIEWAMENGKIFIIQSRPMTAIR